MISNKDILKFETRKKIYYFILQNPGLNTRNISKKMNIPKTTLIYHLRRLQKMDILESKNNGKYTRYYVSKKVGGNDKIILSLLRQETVKQILIYIMFRGCATQKEISEEINKHKTTIGFYMKKLRDMNIIEPALIGDKIVYGPGNWIKIDRSCVGKEKPFRVKDIKLVGKTIETYEKNLSDENIDSLIDWWNLFCLDVPRRVKNAEHTIDSVMQTLFEIFPHPYHS